MTARLAIVPRRVLKILFLDREGWLWVSVSKERDAREECSRDVIFIGYDDNVDGSRVGGMVCDGVAAELYLMLMVSHLNF
jgi:hypothetical protein